MGALIYGRETTFAMDDRTLGHVQVAAGTRLQRRDSFYLSWVVPAEKGSGRVSLWLSPATPLQFQFDNHVSQPLNRQWLQALDLTAVSDHGMLILPEHEVDAFIRRHAVAGIALDDEFPGNQLRRDAHQGHPVRSRVLTKPGERVIHRNGVREGDHTLGLLNDDA